MAAWHPRRTLRRIGQVYVEQARFVLPVALLLFIPLGFVEAWAEHTFELETEDLEGTRIVTLGLALDGPGHGLVAWRGVLRGRGDERGERVDGGP